MLIISESVSASVVIWSTKSDKTKDEGSNPDKHLHDVHLTSFRDASRNDGFWIKLFRTKINNPKDKNANRTPFLVLALSLFLSPLKAMEMEVEEAYRPFDTVPQDIQRLILSENIRTDTQCFWTFMKTCKSFQYALFEGTKHNIITQANQLLRLAIIHNFTNHFKSTPINLDLYYLTTEKELTDEKLANYLFYFPMAKSLNVNMLFLSVGGLGQIENLQNLKTLSLSCDYHGPTLETLEKGKDYNKFPPLPKDQKFTADEMKTIFPIHIYRTMGCYFMRSKFDDRDEYIQEIELRRLEDLDFYFASTVFSSARETSYYGAFDWSIKYRYAYFRSFNEPIEIGTYPTEIANVLNQKYGNGIDFFHEYYLENKAIKVHEALSRNLHTICSKSSLTFLKLPEKMYFHEVNDYKKIYPNYKNYEGPNPTEAFPFLVGHQFLTSLDLITFVHAKSPLKNHISTRNNSRTIIIEYNNNIIEFELSIYYHLLSIHRSKEIVVYLSERNLYLESWKRNFIQFFNHLNITNYTILTPIENHYYS